MDDEISSSSWLMRSRFSRAVCWRLGSVCVPYPPPSSILDLSRRIDACRDTASQSASSVENGVVPGSYETVPSANVFSKEWKERSEISGSNGDFSFPSPLSVSNGRLSDCTSDYFSPRRDDEALRADLCLLDISPNSSSSSLSSMTTYVSSTSSSARSACTDRFSEKHSPNRFYGCRRSNEGGFENRERSNMGRVRSWSQYFAKLGGEKAVLSSEKWMVDFSQLLLGERFACGKHSRLYSGIYRGSPVAVKVVRQPEDEGALSDRLEQIFMQEVTTLSGVQHPNVIRFIAACKKPPVLCVITEYLSGGSLRSYLDNQGGRPLPTRQIVRMALDIASGMEYLHMKGVIHRDLKSENLVLSEDGCVKILDFGVSCFEAKCDYKAVDPGTYRWMAPEMLKRKSYTRKVDVYSFGIVLWELVTTRLPYDDVSAIQAAFSVLNKNRRPSIPSDCSRTLADLMRQCWSTDPSERPEFWEILKPLTMFEHSIDGSYTSFMSSPERHNILPGWLRSV